MSLHKAMPISKLPATYKPLLTKVRQTLILGQQKIEAERVKLYWETGNLIHVHIKNEKARADYGTQVIQRLSEDLGVEDSMLQRCIQFAKKYTRSQIVARGRQFSWSHYRKFIVIPDEKERLQLEDSTRRYNWSAEELSARLRSGGVIRSEDPAPYGRKEPDQTLLTPKRGRLYTYRIIKRPELGKGGETPPLLLDLGFGMYRRLTPRVASRFSAEQIVESAYDTSDESYSLKTSERTAKDLFTYQAVIEKVIDADTLKVRIDLGFDLEHRETLRLRDLDAPEVGTKAGDAAKAFVQSILKEADTIILHTTRSDKYDRYLADVFVGEDIFLNNLLLEKNYAVRM